MFKRPEKRGIDPELDLAVDILQFLRLLRKEFKVIFLAVLVGILLAFGAYKLTPAQYKLVAQVQFLGSRYASVSGSDTLAGPIIDAPTALNIFEQVLNHEILDKSIDPSKVKVKFSSPKLTYPIQVTVVTSDASYGTSVIYDLIDRANESSYVKTNVSIYKQNLQTLKEQYEEYYKKVQKFYEESALVSKYGYLDILLQLSKDKATIQIGIDSIRGFSLVNQPIIFNGGNPIWPFLPFYILGGAFVGFIAGVGIAYKKGKK